MVMLRMGEPERLSGRASASTMGLMKGRIRFSGFELDPVAGELRKLGVRVPVAGQPLEALAVLVSRPGEVVTREELKNALWMEGMHVDFDDGVNTAIRRIRRALGDSATDPRFIETLPRRGYRFIGEVERPEAAKEESVSPAAPVRTWGGMWAYAAAFASLVAIAASITFQTLENGTSPEPRLGNLVSRAATPGYQPRRPATEPADEIRQALSPDDGGREGAPAEAAGGRRFRRSPAGLLRPSDEEIARRKARSATRAEGKVHAPGLG